MLSYVKIIGRNFGELKTRRMGGKKSSSAALINLAKSTQPCLTVNRGFRRDDVKGESQVAGSWTGTTFYS